MKSEPGPLTSEWINDLSVEKRKEVLRGDFGKRMREWAKSYITHFQWTRDTSLGVSAVNNGTCFLLDLGQLYLITAAHVYDGFIKAKQSFGDAVVCKIGHILFDPENHIRDYNKDKDIVIFNFGYEDLARIAGIQAIVPTRWPPPVPKVGLGVFLGGFPGEGRRHWIQQNAIKFGLHLSYTPITVLTDHQITCRWDRKDWVTIVGVPLPAQGADLGGISGGPVLLPLDHGDGVFDFHLIGLIKQASSVYETVVSVPSHFINDDGTISRI